MNFYLLEYNRGGVSLTKNKKEQWKRAQINRKRRSNNLIDHFVRYN